MRPEHQLFLLVLRGRDGDAAVASPSNGVKGAQLPGLNLRVTVIFNILKVVKSQEEVRD